jgi:hypothetical protein
MSVFLTLLLTLRSCARSRAVLQLEVLALRHQLQLLQRTRPRRMRLEKADRWFWMSLSRVWTEWRSALVIVKPETVIAWHRRGFQMFWTWKSRRRTGRPTVPADVRVLIRTMSQTNARWGAPRIHGELLKLGIDVCQATVAKYMAPPPALCRESSGLSLRVIALAFLQVLAHLCHAGLRPRRARRAIALGLQRVAGCSPSVEPTNQGPHIGPSGVEQRSRHTGARMLVGSGAIRHHQPIAGDL